MAVTTYPAVVAVGNHSVDPAREAGLAPDANDSSADAVAAVAAGIALSSFQSHRVPMTRFRVARWPATVPRMLSRRRQRLAATARHERQAVAAMNDPGCSAAAAA